VLKRYSEQPFRRLRLQNNIGIGHEHPVDLKGKGCYPCVDGRAIPRVVSEVNKTNGDVSLQRRRRLSSVLDDDQETWGMSRHFQRVNKRLHFWSGVVGDNDYGVVGEVTGRGHVRFFPSD